jgi:hypothetical protein
VTPSLPVDIVRYLEFLTPKGHIARIDYPNFFEIQGNDIPSVRAWLKRLSDTTWKTIIDKENSTNISSDDGVLKHLPPTLPIHASIDWNTYISDELILRIIQARNWLNPDVTTKYKHAIETSLSYSHEYIGNPTDNPPKLPTSTGGYEIAYLGLSSFIPSSSEAGDETDLQNTYQQQLNMLE